jgi:hypothetical protein
MLLKCSIEIGVNAVSARLAVRLRRQVAAAAVFFGLVFFSQDWVRRRPVVPPDAADLSAYL